MAQSWKWEFGSAILLLISVAAIPATLLPHDRKPVPQWPVSISINALLSIYSMALKACLGFVVTSCIGQLQWAWYVEARPLMDVVLFHEATRGFLGSVQWLWVNFLRQPLTALGALITIVAISIHLFIQQIVQPVDCTHVSSMNLPVSLPRTNYLHYLDARDMSDGLEAAIRAGMYTFQNLTEFHCSTGNCTSRILIVLWHSAASASANHLKLQSKTAAFDPSHPPPATTYTRKALVMPQPVRNRRSLGTSLRPGPSLISTSTFRARTTPPAAAPRTYSQSKPRINMLMWLRTAMWWKASIRRDPRLFRHCYTSKRPKQHQESFVRV